MKAPTASQAIDGNATSAESDAKKNPVAAEERENAEAGTEPSDITETYVAKEIGETLFKECARQADYTIPQAFEKSGEVPKNDATEDIGQGTGWWYDSKSMHISYILPRADYYTALGLTPTFNTWFQVTALHMYILIVRFRYMPPNRSTIWQQHLTNHFFYEAEHRMTLFHKISSRAIRNRYLKDLYNQWRGVQGAYDEGIVKGDAVLATAIWRNVFKGDENVDWRNVAIVTSFARRALKGLDGAKDETIRKGRVRFSSPIGEGVTIEKEARGLKAPFEKVDEDQWVEWEKQVKDAAGKIKS